MCQDWHTVYCGEHVRCPLSFPVAQIYCNLTCSCESDFEGDVPFFSLAPDELSQEQNTFIPDVVSGGSEVEAVCVAMGERVMADRRTDTS